MAKAKWLEDRQSELLAVPLCSAAIYVLASANR
jgi:hypothetical protein